MMKKTIFALATAAMLMTSVAHAGLWSKAVVGTGIGVGGIVAYKMAKKLNIGSVTQNLANHIDNAPKTLDNNPAFIPKVKEDLNVMLNSPEINPEELAKYVRLDDLMRNRYGGGTTIVDPNRQAVINNIRNGGSGNIAVAPPINNGSNQSHHVNSAGITGTDDQILEYNMKLAGQGSKPNGFKAYHIVSVGDVNFLQARKVLMSVGLDINSAENGVYLPTGAVPVKSSEVNISQLDGNPAYANYVNNLLAGNMGNKAGVLNALSDVYLKLSSGDNHF